MPTKNPSIHIKAEIAVGNAEVEVFKPITVKVELIDNEFVAGLEEANIYASGLSPQESIENLKEYLFNQFLSLDKTPHLFLGPAPRRSIAILRNHLKKSSGNI